jgi:hypothetical protein
VRHVISLCSNPHEGERHDRNHRTTNESGTAHIVEAAEHTGSWPTLPRAEELAEPIIAAISALVLWFDERAPTLRYPRSCGELVEESAEVVEWPDKVRALVRNSTLSMVRADHWATELPAGDALIKALTDVNQLEHL